MRAFLRTGCGKQADLPGGDRASYAPQSRGLDLAGARLARSRARMASASARKVLLLGSAIDVRRAPPACEEGLNYLRMHTRFHQTQCEAMEGACTAEERPCREIAKKKRKCRFGPPAPPSRCRTRPRPSAATQSHLHDACFRGHTLVLIGMGPYDWGVIYSYLFCVRRDKDVSRFRTFLAENSGFLSVSR